MVRKGLKDKAKWKKEEKITMLIKESLKLDEWWNSMKNVKALQVRVVIFHLNLLVILHFHINNIVLYYEESFDFYEKLLLFYIFT